MQATTRLYLQDSYCFETDATVLAVQGNMLAFNRTCFYPGGSGQPADKGTATVIDGPTLAISSVRDGAEEIVWHVSDFEPPLNIVGQPVRLVIDKERRLALMRYHTALHYMASCCFLLRSLILF